MRKQDILPYKGKTVKLVKGHRFPFILDGILVDVLEDSVIFKTNTCSSIISFGVIREIRGI